MRILALATCINPAWSGSLLAGECYLIEHHSNVMYAGQLIQQSVLAYHLVDPQIVGENFKFPTNEPPEVGFVTATEEFAASFSQAPLFIGSRSRFELVCFPAQLTVLIQRADDRAKYTSGAYRGAQK